MLSKLTLKLLIEKYIDKGSTDLYSGMCPICEIPFQQNLYEHTKCTTSTRKCPHSLLEVKDHLLVCKAKLEAQRSAPKEILKVISKKALIDWKQKLRSLEALHNQYCSSDKSGFVCPVCGECYKAKQKYCDCGPNEVIQWFRDKKALYTLRAAIQQEVKYYIEELKKYGKKTLKTTKPIKKGKQHNGTPTGKKIKRR